MVPKKTVHAPRTDPVRASVYTGRHERAALAGVFDSLDRGATAAS